MGTQKNRWVGFAKRYGPPFLWAVLITSLSSDLFSAEHSGRFLVPVLHWLFPGLTPPTIDLLHAGIRKAGHLIEYGIFALLWYRALRRPDIAWQLRTGLISLGVAAAFAGLDEFHQVFVPSRTASILDAGLDSLGAACALSAYSVFQRFRGQGENGAKS